jgi:hypothetical protein
MMDAWGSHNEHISHEKIIFPSLLW